MGNAKIKPDTDALLLPYQKRWVLDPARIKVMEKSRQIGISWVSVELVCVMSRNPYLLFLPSLPGT